MLLKIIYFHVHMFVYNYEIAIEIIEIVFRMFGLT